MEFSTFQIIKASNHSWTQAPGPPTHRLLQLVCPKSQAGLTDEEIYLPNSMLRSKEMSTCSDVQMTMQATRIMKRERNMSPPKKQSSSNNLKKKRTNYMIKIQLVILMKLSEHKKTQTVNETIKSIP